MKLIVGLGNPGSEYENTRHNCGFMTIDTFAKRYDAVFTLAPKLKGMIAIVTIDGNKALLLKPMTYMNLSGESVSAVMNYYKIDVEDLIVISDDLDSRMGRIRLRDKGSAGGHNGHKSIMSMIHTEEYKRIKIGIDRSPVISVVDWVLKKYTPEEMITMQAAFDKVADALTEFVKGTDFVKIASKYSTK